MKYCYKSRLDLVDLYEKVLNSSLIEEGIEEKIPKLLHLLPNKVSMDGIVHNVEDPTDKASLIRFIATQFDPSPNAMYITWILKMVKTGILRGMEDRSKYQDVLKKFTELKLKPQFPPQYRDIGKFRSLGDLSEVVDQYSTIKTKKETVRIAKEEGIDLVDTDGEYKLYIVTTSEAGAKHFRNTQWCVKDPRYFDQYGPPYYFFTKNDEPYTLLHLDSDQCMDVQDRNKSLNSSEINMMETEEMTKYVVEHDNSSNSMTNYRERVGKGYDGIIDEFVEKQLTDLISQYDFEHYNLDTDNISEGYYNASGFITYNFAGLEDYFDDEGFIEIVKDSLNHIDKYPDYLDSENFSEDGVSINIEYDSQSDSHPKGKLDQLKSFLSELDRDDNQYDSDIERFEERLTEKLLGAGYISSGWATFKSKVLDNVTPETFSHSNITYIRRDDPSNIYALKFEFVNNFHKNTNPHSGGEYEKHISSHDAKFWGNNPIDKLLVKFFKHIHKFETHIYLKYTNKYIMVTFHPQYDNEKTLDSYMRDFKIFKSLNVHFDEYQKQINWLLGFLSESPRTGNEEIPLFTLRSRKSPPEQEYFQFKEHKITTFNEFYQKINKTDYL